MKRVLKTMIATEELLVEENKSITVEPEIIDDYEKLNKKCDAVISKIETRKKNRKSSKK